MRILSFGSFFDGSKLSNSVKRPDINKKQLKEAEVVTKANFKNQLKFKHMEANYEVLKNDSNYKTAVNYNKGNSFYNFPTTITVNDNKYILGAGSNDRIFVKQLNNNIYIITSNYGLNYLSLEKIDLTNNDFEDCLYLDDNDLSSDESIYFDLLSKSVDEQFNLLLKYA